MAAAAPAILAVVSTIKNQLLQHSARLKGAQTENAGIGPVLEAFDADLSAIVSAYDNGTANASTCIAALQGLDANIYNNLRGNTVDPQGRPIPGAAWSDSIGAQGLCNKGCTAGCCVYFGDLGPVLSMASVAMGGAPIRLAQWGVRDPRYSAIPGGANIKVPEVFASKYGLQDRPSYTISVVAPPPATKVQQGLQSTISELLSGGGELAPNAPPIVSTLANQAPVSLGGVMAGNVGGNPVTLGLGVNRSELIFVVIGVVFVIVVAALFRR